MISNFLPDPGEGNSPNGLREDLEANDLEIWQQICPHKSMRHLFTSGVYSCSVLAIWTKVTRIPKGNKTVVSVTVSCKLLLRMRIE